MSDDDWMNDKGYLMSLQADLDELERTDPEVREAALNFRRMSERMAITPTEARQGDKDRHPDQSDLRHVALNCDLCHEIEINGDYRTRTQRWAYTALRRDAAAKGWAILANQDLCPSCAEHDGCVFPDRCCMVCHRHKALHVDCIFR